MRSQSDIRRLLIELLPAGSEELYDLDITAFIGGTVNALAGAFKDTATDLIDQLRLEVNPSTIDEKIPDWEQACGLSNTLLAQFGTKEQRRNAILSVLREQSSFSLDDIRAAVQPYLLYDDPADIQIVETPRDVLGLAHTYLNGTPVVIGASGSGSSSVQVLDDPAVSPAGATAFISVTGHLDEMTFRLTGPDGRAKNWPAAFLGTATVSMGTYALYGIEFAGAKIRGSWTLSFTCGASAGATLESWGVFVEGLGVNFDNRVPPQRTGQGLGAAIYEFGVVADPALLGVGFDLQGAYKAIQKVKPAHVLGDILVKNSITNDACAIPDEPATLPDQVLPCS